jgi:hypothetical protein
MNRKERRRLQKKKHKSEKELAEKIFLFSKLPDECSACTAPYDKQNKAMAMSWSVVVKQEQEIVRLFCPECLTKAKALTDDKANNKETEG